MNVERQESGNGVGLSKRITRVRLIHGEGKFQIRQWLRRLLYIDTEQKKEFQRHILTFYSNRKIPQIKIFKAMLHAAAIAEVKWEWLSILSFCPDGYTLRISLDSVIINHPYLIHAMPSQLVVKVKKSLSGSYFVYIRK